MGPTTSATNGPLQHPGAYRRRGRAWIAAAALLVAGTGAHEVGAQRLKGSSASLDRQNEVARGHGYTYLRTAAEVRQFVAKGWLVRIQGNRDFTLHAVSFPYARPEVRQFLHRLGAQYRAACGEPLVVTSLTRPISRQPRNASDQSVHPTGMALDLRYSRNRRCHSWLEDVLLELEGRGVLEATRERHPIHYHVALFPKQYMAYVDGITRGQTQVAQAEPEARTPAPPRVPPPTLARRRQRSATQTAAVGGYKVRTGDSLWSIARSHDTTVRALRRANALRGNRIYAGQLLALPTDS